MKNKPIVFDSLAIEVTRRCNMNCEHCMRGNSQPIDINPAYLTKFLSHVDYVLDITLTGGEPTMVCDIIHSILASFISAKVPVENFYVVTNGKVVPDSFILAMINWWTYCDDNEISGVALSIDKYHEKIPDENIKKLKALSFFNDTDKRTDWDKTPLLSIGRGKDFYFTRETEEKYRHLVEYEEEDDYIRIESNITITAKGDILSTCDYSYDETDNLRLANINDPNWYYDFIANIRKNQ